MLNNTEPNVTRPESIVLANIIANTILDKKGIEVIAISVAHVTTIADYFVVASASNTTHVRAIAESIDQVLSNQYSIEPLRREGMQESRWIALDYSTVIVHIFLSESRQYYQLEKLWIGDNNVTKY
ncbi:MAG: ribosome silencing factor [Clostridiales bacterium]|nr:ribosome silencing factor [Clostridiales bacterium]